MNKHAVWLWTIVSGYALLAGPAFAQDQSVTTEVTVQTQADEDSAERTRSFSRVLGTGETASGSSVETIEVRENGQNYTKESNRATLGGQQFSGSINDEIRVEGDTATRDFARTVANETTGQSVTRTRNTEVVDTADGTTWTRDDGISGNERAADSSISGSVVHNEDGTVTYDKDRTVTNAQGEEATRNKSVIVGRDESGDLSIDRQNETTGFDGQSVAREQLGTVSRNEDGSGSYSALRSISGTDANGETRSANRVSSGQWSQNDEGGRDFSGSRAITTSEGLSTASSRSGRTTRDGEGGGTFDSVRERQNGNGSSNRLERKGSVTRDANGTQRTRSKSRTRRK